jgi:hypothetical protein
LFSLLPFISPTRTRRRFQEEGGTKGRRRIFYNRLGIKLEEQQRARAHSESAQENGCGSERRRRRRRRIRSAGAGGSGGGGGVHNMRKTEGSSTTSTFTESLIASNVDPFMDRP